MSIDFILGTDSYKYTHKPLYPVGTETVHSYLEARGGEFNSVVMFGLQMILKKHLEGVRVTNEGIEEAKSYLLPHFNTQVMFLEKELRYIVQEHGGKLPVVIRAMPEGSVVGTRNVLMTVENTDPQCYWLTNFIESLLMQVWYPITVATVSFFCKQLISAKLEANGSPNELAYKLHDFGLRGSTSLESAGIGGAAHLINFDGTDNLPAIVAVKKYYGEYVGSSIPANEHSTVIAWGKENEQAAYEHALAVYPTGNLSIVSDSYDIFRTCREIWGEKLKDKVLSRDGTLIIRPDSGDPMQMTLDVVRILDEKFGSTVNEKGYKVLNPHVRVIQGDGVGPDAIKTILHRLDKWNYSADNVTFGMGGKLLQDLNRDTAQFAIKASQVVVKGKVRDCSKAPATDSGKVSKAGRFKVLGESGKFSTVSEGTVGVDNLEEVFRNGRLTKEYTFSEIRNRVHAAITQVGLIHK